MRNVHGREREPARVRMGRACQYAPAGARTRAAAGARVGRAQARARTKGVCKARACVGSRTHACRRARMQAACRRVRTYARVQAHIHSRLCRLRFESKPSIQISKYPFATGAIGPLSDLGGRFLGGYTMCLQVTAPSRLHNLRLLARGGVNNPTMLLSALFQGEVGPSTKVWKEGVWPLVDDNASKVLLQACPSLRRHTPVPVMYTLLPCPLHAAPRIPCPLHTPPLLPCPLHATPLPLAHYSPPPPAPCYLPLTRLPLTVYLALHLLLTTGE